MIISVALSSFGDRSNHSTAVPVLSTLSRFPSRLRAEFVLRRKGKFDIVPQRGPRPISWRDVEEDFNSSSIGMICNAGPDCRAVVDIIVEGLGGAPVPGAIVVLGYDRELFRQLSTLASRGFQPSTSGPAPYGYALQFEWPTILFLVNIEEPLLDECAEASRNLALAGIPVERVTHAMPGKAEFSDEDNPFSGLIRGFLEDHLVEHFPKML